MRSELANAAAECTPVPRDEGFGPSEDTSYARGREDTVRQRVLGWRRPLTVLLVVPAAAALLSSCSSANDSSAADDPPLTAENIRDRVSEAQRDAETFRFEWVQQDAGDKQLTVGAIEYDESGAVDTLLLSRDGGAAAVRLVDDTVFIKDGTDDFTEQSDDVRDAVLRDWDWADAVEGLPGVTAIHDRSTDEVDGVTTTRYDVDYRGGTVTWWLDEHDRLVKWKDQSGVGTANAFGEDVDVTSFG